MDLRAHVELARPRHWVKQVFVLMPVPFALADGAALDPLALALGLLGFSLTASAVYAWNDASDVALDREHPQKRSRPVAAGRVSVAAARAQSLLLVAGGAALVAAAGRTDALLLLAAYVVIQLLYSWRLKNVPLVDVLALSSGFVLRVLFGCALLAAAPSAWLLLCSSGLALFLSLGMRRAELASTGGEHRPSLRGYSLPFLDQAMVVMLTTTLVAYVLYCLEARVMIPGRELATVPFVVFGLLEYLRRVQVRGEGSSPVDLVLSARWIALCGLGWVAAALWSARPPV